LIEVKSIDGTRNRLDSTVANPNQAVKEGKNWNSLGKKLKNRFQMMES